MSVGPRRIRGALTLAVAMVAAVGLVPVAMADEGSPGGDGTPTRSYVQRVTLPVAPASDFQGSGGGDGWAVALTPTRVLNVHHHQAELTVACRQQADASQCWASQTKTVVDEAGRHFGTWHPGLTLVQSTGRVYVYAVRMVDGVAGVVCIDTGVASEQPNPFCGFTALTSAGQARYEGISNGVEVGGRFYAYNYGSGLAGDRNRVLCFDLSSESACAQQPYSIEFDSGTDVVVPTISAIGGRVMIPSNATGALACFDSMTSAGCAGAWPVNPAGGTFVGGAPFPMLSPSGAPTGVCVPNQLFDCFDLAGGAVPTPSGLPDAAGGATSYWNGPSHAIGARLYVPNGNQDLIGCYDFATSSGCANFPKRLQNQSLTYTVNPDPMRPACLWTNADNGSAQIQNFDAFSGGSCGDGPIRVLASQFVPPAPECAPVEYSRIAVLDPERTAYERGTVGFQDGSGAPIPGADDRELDSAGAASLAGLPLGQNGLPQFLITLEGLSRPLGEVTVEMTWVGPAVEECGDTEVDVCVEDGIAILQEYGIASALLHAYEPSIDVLSKDLAPTVGSDLDLDVLVHQVNCAYVVPLEDSVDQFVVDTEALAAFLIDAMGSEPPPSADPSESP